MADRSVATTNTLEEFRTTFNSLATDLGDIASVTGASGVIASATDVVEAVVQLNTKVNTIVSGSSVFTGNLIFEGSTDDSFETTLAITDPTADRTIALPNVSGTILTTGNSDSPATTTSSSDVDHFLIDDGGTMKKITTTNLGLATNAFAIAQAVALG